jgi:hypothetical protein
VDEAEMAVTAEPGYMSQSLLDSIFPPWANLVLREEQRSDVAALLRSLAPVLSLRDMAEAEEPGAALRVSVSSTEEAAVEVVRLWASEEPEE